MGKSIIKLKSELLCLGARVEAETAKLLAAEYPRFFDKGFIHAVNLRLAGIDVNICVSVSEEFSAGSPYEIVKIGEDYRLVGNGWDEEISFYPNLPHTGTVVDDLAQLHSPTCINIWPSTTCCYDTPELKCRFCSLKADADKPIDTAELAEGLKLLLAQVPKEYILNFSGGTYHDPDWMVRYWIDLARKIREFSQVSITVEFAPPSDLGLLREMKDAGINVAIMNLEVADETRRKEICPGKSHISYAHYHEAFREAVKVFGWGMVSSVLIGGIQPKEEIMKECAIMASEGVFPTVMPFRPMDDCVYYGLDRCKPEELAEMAEYLGGLLHKYALDFRKQPGCTECGGCSLENDCYRRREKKTGCGSIMMTNETMRETLTEAQKEKLDRLRENIRSLGSLAVGFSGGVDSSLLVFVAHEVLGDQAIAVTGVDASVPEREVEEAKQFCARHGIRHFLCPVDPLKEEGYRHNGPDRCYFCKHGIFTEVKRIAAANGIAYMAEGSNTDDLGDYRPGLRAVAELAVKSPLREAGLSKADIRLISKYLGLPSWSKPAYACLASRFVYGEEITEEKLRMIDRAEQFLIEHGFFEERVRIHGNIARIEVPPKDISRLASEEIREAVYRELKDLGFLFVTLDLRGYRTGSMNATLKKPE